MSANNKVMLIANLTRDAELRVTSSGSSVLSFGIAVNDRRRDSKTGEAIEYANFFDCSIFGKRADALEKYMKKGVKVAIEGRLHWSSWEKDGQRRTKVEVWVEDIEFLSSSRKSDGAAEQPSVSDIVPEGTVVTEIPDSAYSDKDIPF